MMHALPQVERGNNVFEVDIRFEDLTVEKKEIITVLGYPEGAIPVHFDERIDQILARLPEMCHVGAGYRLLDVRKPEDARDGLLIGEKFFFLQKIVTTQLGNSQRAALFVCTIGHAMETWSKNLAAEGDEPGSFLVDTVASVTAEHAVDCLHDHVEKCMEMQGLKITNRYSPGYCNWPVAEQHLLFSFLPQNFCGITLTESALMLPIKSVSGIIGIGPDVHKMDYVCDRCFVKDCTYRNIVEAKKERAKSSRTE
jgi:hypothetical protein